MPVEPLAKSKRSVTVAYDESGVWSDLREAKPRRGSPALFLDRDGTLIEHIHFLADPAELRAIGDAVAAVRAANRAGWAVVVVTNQSGIGRGYFGWPEFEAVQAALYRAFDAAGACIDAAYACPHPPPGDGGPNESRFRKPAPGMLLRAADDLGLDLARSWIAGDGAHDLAAGRSAGLAGGWLVPSGYGSREEEIAKARALASAEFEVVMSLPLGGIAARL